MESSHPGIFGEVGASFHRRARAGTGLASKGLRSFGIGVAAVLLSVFVGRATFYGAVYQEKRYQLLLAAVAGFAVFLIFSRLGARTLLVWVPLSGLAYAFVRFPRISPVVTFDRIWIFGLLAIVLSATPVRPSRPSQHLRNALIVMVAVFGVQAVMSDGFSSGTLSPWVDAFVLPLIVFVAASKVATSEQRMSQIGGALVLAGLGLSLLGIAERIGGFELATRVGGVPRYDAHIHAIRISGPYADPEPYAVVVMVCLAATLYWTQLHKRYFLGSIIAVLECAAIALTFFRAAWIATLLVIVIALAWRPKQHARAIGLIALLSAIGLFAYIGLERSSVFTTRIHNTQNIYTRFGAYHEAFRLFRESPLTGVGVGQYHDVVQTTFPSYFFHGVQAVSYAHSSFLSVLAEQGVIGFIPFLIVIIVCWQLIQAFRRRAKSHSDVLFAASLLGVALAYLVMSLTLTMLPYGMSNEFVALLFGMAAGRLNTLDSEAPQPPGLDDVHGS